MKQNEPRKSLVSRYYQLRYLLYNSAASLINFVWSAAKIIKIPWVAWNVNKWQVMSSSCLCGNFVIIFINFLDCWSWA